MMFRHPTLPSAHDPSLFERFRSRPLCESCQRRKARPHDPFCSHECAETYLYYA